MNREEAMRILRLSEPGDLRILKREYRRLMKEYHPDSSAGDAEAAKQLNAAYAWLLEHFDEPWEEKEKDRPLRKKQTGWNAPLVPRAFTDRQIFHEVQDSEGEVMGTFSVARGPYLWTADEPFHLFLKSIYEASERVLEDHFSGELSYEESLYFRKELMFLLSAQFIDPEALLERLTKSEETEQGRIYRVQAMLEEVPGSGVRKGEMLIPERIREHRLYLKTAAGKKAGYLSFADDRLYYALIPLLEARRLQLRTEAEERVRFRHRVYRKLNLAVRFLQEDVTVLADDLNQRIRNLLEKLKN